MPSIYQLRQTLLQVTHKLHRHWIRPMRVEASAIQLVLAKAARGNSKQSLDAEDEEGDGGLSRKIYEALGIIDGVLSRYGEEKVAISFNGGKDCTVLIHLMAACLYARHQNIPLNPSSSTSTLPAPPPLTSSPSLTSISGILPTLYPPIPSIYITSPNPFEEMEEFVNHSAEVYNMNLVRFGGGMKVALKDFLESEVGKGMEAVLVGTRRGDPHGAQLQTLSMTDPSWPQFMRVHPILDWSYQNVWDFLRGLNIPYCSLYDQGYTSLGSTHNTHPNPCLKNPDMPSGFDPAWMLEDETLERCGRGDPVKDPTKALGL